MKDTRRPADTPDSHGCQIGRNIAKCTTKTIGGQKQDSGEYRHILGYKFGLDQRRNRNDLIEKFKILNGMYYVSCEDYFQLATVISADRKVHSKKGV